MQAESRAAAGAPNSETTQNTENRNYSRELDVKWPAFTSQPSLMPHNVALFI